ncbi:Vitamin B12 import ATP-binding protein BtuD [bioreactor metagenome]|uniref:Vitamin B12 import ATP-binding protein BtuD n=1 Tax=bioreactor metagenome TaxID=1076179 RepID=A0A645J0H0_9ZZZZ
MVQYTDKKLDTLSKGNQQKIQLVVTLISDPDIIILDEPFSGLDPVNAMLLKDIIKERIQRGKIVLFSSHQMNYIEEFCDDIVILKGGSAVLSGNIRKIKRSYSRSEIAVSGPDLGAIRDFAANELRQFVRNAQLKDDIVRITLADEADKGRLMSALADRELDIDEFRVYEPSLNDIFVEYTEDAV